MIPIAASLFGQQNTSYELWIKGVFNEKRPTQKIILQLHLLGKTFYNSLLFCKLKFCKTNRATSLKPGIDISLCEG